MLSVPPGLIQEGSQLSRSWLSWFSYVTDTVNATRSSGTSLQRPVRGLYVGRFYFDTTLTLPVWYDGGGWIDAAGNSV